MLSWKLLVHRITVIRTAKRFNVHGYILELVNIALYYTCTDTGTLVYIDNGLHW